MDWINKVFLHQTKEELYNEEHHKDIFINKDLKKLILIAFWFIESYYRLKGIKNFEKCFHAFYSCNVILNLPNYIKDSKNVKFINTFMPINIC